MTTRHALLHPSTVRGLLDLSNPKKSVCLPLERGRAAGPLELIQQLFPPRGASRVVLHNTAPVFTMVLEGSVTHSLPVMMTGTMDRYGDGESFACGFIQHDHWFELAKQTGLGADAQCHWVAVRYNSITREGRIYLYNEAFALIEAAHKEDLERVRARKGGEREHPVRVLLADDTRNWRQRMERILTRAGCEVASFENGGELLRELEEGDRYDFVVTDNQMPMVSGLEVLRHVRHSKRFAHLPVVVFTSDAEPIKEFVTDLGGILLEKGTDLEDIEKLIAELVKQAKEVS